MNACIVAGNVGIKDSSPWGDLNIGDCAVVGSSGHAGLGKNNGAGNRNFKQSIHYKAPASSFVMSSNESFVMKLGYSSSN